MREITDLPTFPASYKVIKDPGNDDTCTLVFTASAPYETIAFTIVNKQWEQSSKRGFRCSFDRGVLQLYVQLKREFYRSVCPRHPNQVLR